MSKAWKRHELETAKFFGTSRRNRGNDFGVSDVEVLVDTNDWLDRSNPQGPFIVVECKYSKKMGIVNEYKKLSSMTENDSPMIKIGDYIVGNLEDFKEIYLDFIDPGSEPPSLTATTLKYDIISSRKKTPKYLDDYYEQARDYTMGQDSKRPYFAMVCVAKANSHGRLFVCHLNDIKELWDNYNEKINF